MSELTEITIPPVEIRTLIGKTAIYVNKNGVAFENKIKTKEANNPKFFFLSAKDPYNAYYQYALSTIIKTGKPPVINNKNEDVIKQKIVSSSSSSDNNSKTNIEDNNILVKPIDYHFLQHENNKLIYPEYKISTLDLNMIKLVSQFSVINGDKIMEKFKLNVLSNPKRLIQFGFLKEEHSMNPIYKKYVNIYNKIWTEKIDLIKEYTKNTDIYNKLNECFGRAEYLEKESTNVKEIEEKKLLERLTYGSIDWQDFVIVETIKFTEMDEVSELNLPFIKSDLEYRSLIQKENESLFSQVKDASQLREEEEEEEEEEEQQQQQQQKQKEDYQGEIFVEENDHIDQSEEILPSYQESSDEEKTIEFKKEEEYEEEKDNKNNSLVPEKRVPKGMKIKSAGESRILKRKFKQTDNGNMIDPITKEKLLRCPLTDKLIPESEFQNYINSLLRDPKYEEEKARYESKFKYGSNLTTDQVYENIQRLVEDKSNKKKKSV